MANTKISQLPSYTGSAADLRWFVMNNSGETETYKYSGYTSQLIPGTGGNSYRTLNAIGASGTDSLAIGPDTNATFFNSIAFGRNVQSTNDFGFAFGGGSTASGFVSLVMGYASIASGGYSIMIGAEGNSSGSQSIAIGRFGNASGGDSIAIGASTSETIQSSIVGAGNLIRNSQYGNIFGSNNTINTTAGYNNNNIFGGINNNISGNTSGTTLIGLSGYTDANINDCTYVNNLQVLRTPSTKVQPVSSGTTFTCNLDNGAKSQFYITGTSTINITNVRDGASFMIKTQTDGNYVMTWTATGGYTFLFEGGIKDPGNNVTDIFVFEVFGSVIYGNRRHNYS
jgi:hypothetical protein